LKEVIIITFEKWVILGKHTVSTIRGFAVEGDEKEGSIFNDFFFLLTGAKINIANFGRSPLSIAAHQGNIPMLELLLNSGRFSPQRECPNHTSCSHPLPYRKAKNKNDSSGGPCIQGCTLGRRSKRKRSLEDSSKGNNGYYVIVHEDDKKDEGMPPDINKNSAPSIDEVTTPEGMDNLEWDLEVKDEDLSVEEEDLWSNQYRWYAKILANTYCSVMESPNICDVNLQDSIGRCAIHYAAEYGHANAVKLLINAGTIFFSQSFVMKVLYKILLSELTDD
jgi:ankyrin repeat protein